MTGSRQARGALAFIQHEAAGGLLLVGAAIAPCWSRNSPLQGLYRSFLSAPIGFSLSSIELEKPVLLWINDGLMAMFFFLVGPRDQARAAAGRALQLRQGRLAGVAAAGGMVSAGADLRRDQCR